MIYKEQDVGLVNADIIITARQSNPIVLSYTPANNSYQTTAQQITPPDIAVKEAISTTNNNIASSLTNNDRSQTESVGETLLTWFGFHRILNNLYGDHSSDYTKANCLSTRLLGAALFISVINTLLLSFVVKSIQLNERGFIYGKISWDDHLESTIFELPTKVMEGKSISLKSIESYADDKTLILEKISDTHSGGKYTLLNNVKQDYSSWKHHQALADNRKRFSESNERKEFDESVFLSNSDSSFSERKEGAAGPLDDVALSKSNYLSVNLNDYNNNDNQFAIESRQAAFLMRTNLMVLNQIIEKQTRNSEDLSNKWSLSSQSKLAHQLTTMSSSNVDETNFFDDGNEEGEGLKRLFEANSEYIKPLLILDGEQQSVTLPSESQLSLNLSFASGSTIILDEQLRSSEITGSLEEDFNIQTRDGNLACESKETMKLMSRSAGIKITSSKEMALKAPSLNLKSAGNLYIQNGVEYFDSLPDDHFESNGNKVYSYENDKEVDNDERSNNILSQSDAAQTDYHHSGVIANGNGGNNYALRAYNLVVADGILMAMA